MTTKTDKDPTDFETIGTLWVTLADGRQIEITDPAEIERIIRGQLPLGVGYHANVDMTPGIAPDGTPYDGVVNNLVLRHASVIAKDPELTRAFDRLPGIVFFGVTRLPPLLETLIRPSLEFRLL